MKIYVASSWKNAEWHSAVVAALRLNGFEVNDFKDHSSAPSSPDDPPVKGFKKNVPHPNTTDGCYEDMMALKQCDACVLVLPCGRHAHLELGWAASAGKKTFVLMDHPATEPVVTYLMHGQTVESLDELIAGLKASR